LLPQFVDTKSGIIMVLFITELHHVALSDLKVIIPRIANDYEFCIIPVGARHFSGALKLSASQG
jgi:hypothetical protein